jgi:large subunit ribosomal protein L3
VAYTAVAEVKEGVAAGILGRKLGMTQVFRNDVRLPVTVIQAGPCTVLQVKTVATDGYNAVQLGFEDKKETRTTRPMLGHFAKSGGVPKRFVREFRSGSPSQLEPGDTVGASVLEGASLVDIQGVSKGKGWAGTIKRWNFGSQRASHGNSINHRRAGSIGRTYSTAKGVPKNKKMGGRLGGESISTIGLEVVEIDAERNILLVKGAVPGANGGYLVIRRSYKDKAGRAPSDALY